MKSNSFLTKFMLVILLPLCFWGCTGDEEDGGSIVSINQNGRGLYVLSEGLYGHNNSSLTYYNLNDSSTIEDIFLNVNNRGLGETANDMVEMNGKIFIAVQGSAVVVCLDEKTGKSLAMIPTLNANGKNREPRHLVAYNGYMYLSCFDGNVLKINPNTYKIEKTLATGGRNPEGLDVYNNKLYVANSGGLGYNTIGYDNSVSVIDLETFTLKKKITLHSNPTIVKCRKTSINHSVYVVSMGDYSSSPMMTVIDANDSIVDSAYVPLCDFEIMNNGNIVYINGGYNASSAVLAILNADDIHSSPTNIALPSDVKAPYHIDISDKNIFVMDAKNYTVRGTAYVFDYSGNFLYSFSTGINPNRVIVVNTDLVASN